MTAISPTIRNIRKRLGKTMAQFADMIGCRQSTVSRYESGKLIPGRTVLILLLQYAQASERPPILDALGVSRAAAAGWEQRKLVDASKTFGDCLKTSPTLPVYAPGLVAFAKAARQIVSKGPDVEPSLAPILRHWIKHSTDPKAHQYFRHIAAYLDVKLRVLEARCRPKRRP